MSFILNIFKPLGILLIFQFTMSNAQQKLSNNRIQKLKSETKFEISIITKAKALRESNSLILSL